LLAEQLQGLAAAIPDGEEKWQLRLEVLACCRETGDDMLAAGELNNLFSMELHAGRVAEGAAYLEEAVALTEGFGGELVLHFVRSNLALLRLIQGRHAEAAPLNRGCLLVSRRLGPGIATGELVFAAACCATWQGDYLKAARLHGAGDADIDASLEMRTINWSPAEQQLRSRDQDALRQHLGDAAFEDAYRSGAAMTNPEAVALALTRPASS
jgi:hypothetical protein